jgi:hypothetical protein
MVNTNISTYTQMSRIKFQDDSLPRFKGEKDRSEELSNEELTKQVASAMWKCLADAKGKKVCRKEEENKIKATLFYHVANAIGSNEDSVRETLKTYVSQNKGKALDMARKISQQTGMSIGEISAEDFASLITCKDPSNHRVKLIKRLFGDQQGLRHLHLANYTLAEIISEVFKINVTLRDYYFNIDRMFTSAFATEQVCIESKSSDNKIEIELVQGWAMAHNGIFAKDPDLKVYHLSPVALVA